MRFDGKRQVPAGRDALWQALHDPHVLREVVTGCESVTHLDAGTYAATMVARVGPVTDTYRGTFTITDLRDGAELRVRVGARGRCGRLDLDLRVWLADDAVPGSTTLTYVAEAQVGGLVSRISGGALRVFGNHVTGCFFRGLEGAVAPVRRRALVPA
jgi:carbon monoxide dehydrogenase subunit G